MSVRGAVLSWLVWPAAFAAAASQAPEISNLEEQLRAAEIAFAQTMAQRDHAAFSSFIADEAIFYGSEGEIRGKGAVVEAWQGFFEGPRPPFSWRPETVSVLDSGTLGLTSGPVFDPEGNQIATFQSVWRRTSDGRWEILFDKGCNYCEDN